MTQSRELPSRGGASAFAGGSEMHGRVRALDWSTTPLGPVEAWPQGLKAVVKTLLASRYPMLLTWGPAFTQIYNDAYSKLIGDKHPAALGIDVRVTLAESWDTLGPMIAQVMATGVANWTPALLLLLERAGYREEAWFSVSHAPAEDDAGAVVGMLAVCSEVTQQVVGERRLRLLRELASKAVDPRGVEKTCAAMLGALGGLPLDVPFALLYLRDSDEAPLTLRGAVGLADGAVGDWPLERAASGETVRVEDVERRVAVRGGAFGDPVRTALVMPLASFGQGAPLGVLVAGVSPHRALDEGYGSFYELLAGQVAGALRNARAYEEERQRAEALAELDRAKTAFFNNISHEFRTPLTLMLGPVEDLLAGGAGTLPPEARHELEWVHRNALRLLRLVNTLLDFSRLEAGRAEASFTPTDLAALTVDLASGFRSAFERAGLTLTVDCPPLSERVWVDREMWEKVVLNLLSNALKFTFEGGVTVRLREEDGRAVLEVADTGTGVPAEELSRLFERFHRVRGARGRTHEGSGIGLSLVRELARLHGGDVRAESAEGEGTTFYVSLPLGRAHLPAERLEAPRSLSSSATGAAAYVEEALRGSPEAPSAEAAAAPGPEARDVTGRSARGHVLVVDDNADMREYLGRVLSPGFDVTLAEHCEAALALVRERGPFDLVLTDVMMPRLGGFGLLKALREEPRTRALPVIMLSARAGEEAAVEGLEAGADDYLVKPFSAREVVARTRSALELARMRREVARRELTESHLREAVRLRDEFLSVASHELKTPLTAFRLQLELVGRNLGPEARARVGGRLTSAARQLMRLSGLVENMLDVSQLASGGVVLSPMDVDLRALAADALEQVREEAERAASPLVLHAGAPLVAPCDRQRMEQVLSHLLRNAVKYGAGRPVEVRLEAADGAALLAVVDHGLGVAPEDRPRIFERFERAVSTRHYGGFGLGLWLARELVESHGGTLSVSDTPGGGATFTVQLPLDGTRMEAEGLVAGLAGGRPRVHKE